MDPEIIAIIVQAGGPTAAYILIGVYIWKSHIKNAIEQVTNDVHEIKTEFKQDRENFRTLLEKHDRRLYEVEVTLRREEYDRGPNRQYRRDNEE